MKKTILALLFVIAGFLTSSARQASGVEMATALRSSGKIYVVVLVLSVILIGIGIYLFTVDRKVTRLEKQLKK